MLQCIHQFSTACCCDLALVLRFQWAVLMARCHWIVTLGLETQMLSIPAKCQGNEGLRRSHPRRFYGVSIGALRFQSAVLMVRCSHRIVALGLEMQLYKIYRGMITAASIHPYHPRHVLQSLLSGKGLCPYPIVSLPRRSTSSFILNQQSSSPWHPFTLYVDVHFGVNSLEHLLVYTPSGYVIKLELLPSIEAEPNESDPATWSGSYVHS
ncbi:unnamed protein product [Ilex paraguariensis]|uniref:Uncharacterized protein n=1 Tax=Ilex paraguariensis TaxID=185542 RepID=A0ABC8TA51_9AQUA